LNTATDDDAREIARLRKEQAQREVATETAAKAKVVARLAVVTGEKNSS
jgi:hypothetical protein